MLILAALILAADIQPQAPLFASAPASPVVVGEGSGTIILRDVTGDRLPDLLTRHLLTRRIEVMRGDGKGGFTTGRSILFEYEPGDMKMGDMNHDGVFDLVVTSGNRDIVDVLLGNSRGEFTPADGSPFTVSRVIDTYNKRTLHLLDLNEDGHLDIATANGRLRNTVRTLLGNGRAGFIPGPIVRLDTRGDGFSLVFADINGDGHQDAVSASGGSEPGAAGRVAVQQGDGQGNFGMAQGSPMRVPPAPSAVAVADINGDGRLDIVTGHRDNLLSVLLNQGPEGFTPATSSPYEIEAQVFMLAAVDINGDRKADLVLPTVDRVTVLLADGAGFSPAPGSPYQAGPGSYYVSVGDVNRDGKLDIAATSFEGDRVTILLGQERR